MQHHITPPSKLTKLRVSLSNDCDNHIGLAMNRTPFNLRLVFSVVPFSIVCRPSLSRVAKVLKFCLGSTQICFRVTEISSTREFAH